MHVVDLLRQTSGLTCEATYRGGLGFATTTDPVKCGIASSPGEYWWAAWRRPRSGSSRSKTSASSS